MGTSEDTSEPDHVRAGEYPPYTVSSSNVLLIKTEKSLEHLKIYLYRLDTFRYTRLRL